MPTRCQKIIILIFLILFFFFFLLPSASEENNDDNGIVIDTQDPNLIKALLVGDGNMSITNPRTVSFEKLLANNKDYQNALKADKERKPAKFSIYEVWATQHVMRLIREYASKNNFHFIFKEEPFFQFLRTIPDFEHKTDAELRKQFDITDKIIEYEKKKEVEEKKDNPSKKLKKVFSDNIFAG